MGWLPPEGEDQALWHVVHDDGDEEDLDIDDVRLDLYINACDISLVPVDPSQVLLSYKDYASLQ